MITPEQREAIFRLRAQEPPLSVRAIAEAVNLPRSTVDRELKRTAPPAPAEGGVGPFGTFASTAKASPDDPDLADAVKRVELKRLAIAEAELDFRQKELEQRRGLVDRPGQDGGAALTLAVLDAMRDLRREVDTKFAQLHARPADGDPLAGLVKGLATLAEAQKQLQVFAPPRAAAVTPGEIDLRVQLEKVNIESKALVEKAASEARRNDMFTSMMTSVWPDLVSAGKRWFEEKVINAPPNGQSAGTPPLRVVPSRSSPPSQPASPQPAVDGAPSLGPGDIWAVCDRCHRRAVIHPEAGQVDVCTCGGTLQPSGLVAEIPRSGTSWPEDAIIG